MKYITVRKAAEKWGISERLVQQHCNRGRIVGADKFGKAWAIPEDAEKPLDPRHQRKKASDGDDKKEKDTAAKGAGGMGGFPFDITALMPFMSASFEPGESKAFLDSIEDKDVKSIACAEYCYFRGQAREAANISAMYIDSPNFSLRLSACLIYAYANLPLGRVRQSKAAIDAMLSLLRNMGTDTKGNGNSGIKAMISFAATTAATLLHMPLSDENSSLSQNIGMLTPGLKGFAFYVQAHRMYLEGRYRESIGLVEAALQMEKKVYNIPYRYLNLIAVVDYVSLRETEKAKEHFMAAWNIAEPDGLIEAFGEHHGLLGGILEVALKKERPEDFKRMIAITYSFSEGWRKVHNPATGHDVADNLTTTEFTTAMLAARGWTNGEIGEHLGISVNTVRQYISAALQKLGVSQRKELKDFMLK